MFLNLRLACLAALVALLSGRAVQAATVPLSFSGPEQEFAATLDLTSSLSASGDGYVFNAVSKMIEPFTATPPLTHAGGALVGPVAFAGNPESDASRNPTLEIVDNHVTQIDNLYLKLFNNGSIPLALETLTVTTDSKVALLKNLTIDASAEIINIAFEQSAPGTFVPTGPGVGTFAIPGQAIAEYANIQSFLAGILPFPLGVSDGFGTNSTLFTGNYKVTGTPGNTKVELDGDGNYQFVLFYTRTAPLEFQFSISAPLAVTISGLVNFGVVAGADLRFHLEQSGIVVPEPGSVTLLFLGLAVLSSCVGYRRLRQQRNVRRSPAQS